MLFNELAQFYLDEYPHFYCQRHIQEGVLHIELCDHTQRVASFAHQMLNTQQCVLKTTQLLPKELPWQVLLLVAAEIFCEESGIDMLSFVMPNQPIWLDKLSNTLIERNISFDEHQNLVLMMSKALFWTIPDLWLSAQPAHQQILAVMNTQRQECPTKPSGVIYQRFIPALNRRFSMRVVTLDDHDIDLLCTWMNLPDVAATWDMAGDRSIHKRYLEEQQRDPHQFAVFAAFDNEPFGYFELYWAKEDRIAPFYEVGEYDRGIHLLIGNSAHQSALKIKTWFNSLVHYLFLVNPCTQAVVGEPRADNLRLNKFLKQQGMMHLKDFDFPHKRASLMYFKREVFFNRYFSLALS